MEITFKFNKSVYAINIGYKTAWFEQSYFITIERLWFDRMKVSYAEMLFHS